MVTQVGNFQGTNGEGVHQLHIEDNPTVLTPSLFPIRYLNCGRSLYNLVYNLGLEPGLRMLYTLEQEAAVETIQNRGSSMENDEDLANALTSPYNSSSTVNPRDILASDIVSPKVAAPVKNGNKKRKRN